MNLNFRSSLHGFNRQDVANYLEYLNNRHAAQVNQLNTDLEALRRQAEAPAEDPQRAALETRCQELELQLAAARKERDEALAQKSRKLCFRALIAAGVCLVVFGILKLIFPIT